MKGLENENTCPKCGAAKMKTWNELDFEQKIIVERLPASADYTRQQRKKHRFCVKCNFEETRLENYLT